MSGFLAVRGGLDAEQIEAMLAAGSHRGPAETFSEGDVFIASLGAPLCVAGDLVVALDARLDVAPEGPFDAARFAAAWRAGGIAALTDVIGDFAGVVYDRRHADLLVVRDAMGQRPALLSVNDRRVAAASSMPMLLADPTTPREPDETWVAAYLSVAPVFRQRTAYRAVSRLIPHHVAIAANGAWRTSQWYRFPRGTMRGTHQALVAGFGDMLDAAVADRVAGAGRIAVSLSGGMDSTSVAAVARRVRPDAELLAYGIGFEGRAADERHLQSMVADRVGATLRWVSLDGYGPFGAGAIPTLQTYGAPPLSPNWFFLDALAHAAVPDRPDVFLDGIDGDGVVGGSYAFLSDLAIRLRLRQWLHEARTLRRTRGASKRWIIRDQTLGPLLPWGSTPSPSWLSPRTAALAKPMWRAPWRPGFAFATDHRLSVGPDIAPVVFESIDEQFARAGLRVAHPFMDRRLVEYSLRLPRRLVTSLGMNKVVLRAAMRDLLPPEVTERAAKADLSEGFSSGLSGIAGAEVLEGLPMAAAKCASWLDPFHATDLISATSEDDRFDAYRIAWMGQWQNWLEMSNANAHGG